MSLMLAALLAQSVSLDADRHNAAKQCAAASVMGSQQEPSLRIVARMMYFVTEAVREKPDDKPFFARLNEISAELGAQPAPDGIVELLPACLERYPLAHADRVVTLPADRMRRDALCLSVYSLLMGAAQEYERAGEATGEAATLQASANRISNQLTDEALAAEGIIDGNALQAAMAREMLVSAKHGNAEMVRRACDKAGV